MTHVTVLVKFQQCLGGEAGKQIGLTWFADLCSKPSSKTLDKTKPKLSLKVCMKMQIVLIYCPEQH